MIGEPADTGYPVQGDSSIDEQADIGYLNHGDPTIDEPADIGYLNHGDPVSGEHEELDRQELEQRILAWLNTAELTYPDTGHHPLGELIQLTGTTAVLVQLTEDGTTTVPLVCSGGGWCRAEQADQP